MISLLPMNDPDHAACLNARDRLTADCETMKMLLTGLLDSKGRIAEEIHAIRKLGKSIRGGFALFRLEDSASLEIQAIGRLLSEPRDAVSRLNTWNKLGVENSRSAAAISTLLEQQTHSAARRPPQDTIAWCQERVNVALEELHSLPLESLPVRVAKGLAYLEKRLFKRCRGLDHREEEDFHKARKAVKAWLGAVGFLPGDPIGENSDLNELAELLGDENDLATLSAWLEEHGFSRRLVPDLWETVETARRRVQRKAIKDARRVLAARPS